MLDKKDLWARKICQTSAKHFKHKLAGFMFP